MAVSKNKPAPKKPELNAESKKIMSKLKGTPAKPAPKSKGPVPKPMPAPKGGSAESGMGGKVAKGSKNPIKKLVNKVRRTK